jgi:glycine reductase
LPEDFTSSDYEIAHTGYFPDEVLGNPSRLVPVDVVRDLVKGGEIGKLHPTFFCTSGNATVTRRCAEMGDEIIEKLGIPVIQITAVPNVAQMVGINRILRGQTVPCVVGNSALNKEQEKALRRKIILRALEILQMEAPGSKKVFTLEGTE